MVYLPTLDRGMNFYLVFLVCFMVCWGSVCEAKGRPSPTVVKNPIKRIANLDTRIDDIHRRQDIVTRNSGIDLAAVIKKSVQRVAKSPKHL
jgi:hypothetical protein